jgi:hypothetical protein
MKTKKILILPVLLIMATTIISSCQRENLINDLPLKVPVKSFSLSQSSPSMINLIAGQHINVGYISLSFDTNNLYVDYITTGGWYMEEIHLWIGSSINTIPMGKGENPRIGHFPYKYENLNKVDNFRVTIPLSSIGGYSGICDQMFYIAAHAVVVKTSFDQVLEETAWGEGDRFAKGNWAMYFGFTFDCSGPGGGPQTGVCETAYGFGSTTFVQAGLANKWGWIITITQEGIGTTPLYAGAGQNLITPNTIKPGVLNWNYTGGVLTVHFEMFPGFTMSETHLYASLNPPTTAAPGLYGNTHTLSAATSDTFVIPISMVKNGAQLPVYVIAHAVVCN